MFLGECPVFMIMLIGTWSSNTFLIYIRKQVIEFSQNMSKRMLTGQISGTSQISIPELPQMTQESGIILRTPRQEKMLVATCIAMSGCLHSLGSTENA